MGNLSIQRRGLLWRKEGLCRCLGMFFEVESSALTISGLAQTARPKEEIPYLFSFLRVHLDSLQLNVTLCALSKSHECARKLPTPPPARSTNSTVFVRTGIAGTDKVHGPQPCWMSLSNQGRGVDFKRCYDRHLCKRTTPPSAPNTTRITLQPSRPASPAPGAHSILF